MAKALHRLGNLELMRLAKGVVQSVIVPWQDLLNIRTGHPGPPGALAAENEDFQVAGEGWEGWNAETSWKSSADSVPCQGSVALRATPSYRKRSRWMGSISQRCKSWIRAGSTWGDLINQTMKVSVKGNDPNKPNLDDPWYPWSRSWDPDLIAKVFVLPSLWYPSLQKRHRELPPESAPTVKEDCHASTTSVVVAAASKKG